MIDFLKEFDLHQIISIVVAVYFVTNFRFKKLEERFKQVEERFKHVEERFKEIDFTLKSINQTLISLDNRLTRLEGRFDERGYWESRDKKIGE